MSYWNTLDYYTHKFSFQPYSSGGDELDSVFEKLTSELEQYVQNVLGAQVLPQVHSIMDLLLMTRRNREDIYAMSLIQKVVFIKNEVL